MFQQEYPLYAIHQIKNLKELIEHQARFNPEKCAFSYKDKSRQRIEISREEFLRDMKKACLLIEQKGFNKTHIALAAENSYLWVLFFLAAILTGNVGVAINKDLEPAEIHELLQKADAEAILYQKGNEELLEQLPAGIQAFSLESLQEELNQMDMVQADAYFKNLEQDPEELACIFFTSGTTGSSKGVMLSQKNICADINASCQLFRLDGDTVSLLPFHHAFGFVTAILMVFNYGGSTFICSSLRRILPTLAEEKPQTLFLVPLFVETFYKRIWKEISKTKRSSLSVKQMMHFASATGKYGFDVSGYLFKKIQDTFGGNLEYIICGGAPLDEKYIDDFKAWGINILNGYGITECSPVVSVNRNHFQKKNSIGQMVPGIEARSDENGELWIHGDIVMKGYYNDPVETRRILKDGWLNTEDLGYADEDGFLFLTGRKKNLIILSNGENISPEQIEMKIGVDKAVMEVIVYEKNNQVVAEIYPTAEYRQDPDYFDKLISRYNRRHPASMRINRFELRDEEFEKNATQKIMRNKV